MSASKSKRGFSKENFAGKVFFLLLKVLLLFLVFSLFQIVVLRFLPVYRTPLMYSRWIQEDYEIEHDWVPYGEISENMAIAMVAAEDGNFMNHKGFDLDALVSAAKHNAKGGNVHGGSTISQQTAKNVFLWQGRSFLRKGLEAYYTFLIEFCWDKKRIMEVYLNSIEFGPGIYGVEAASQHYYNCKASELTQRQAESLAAIVPSPLKRNPLHPDAVTLRHRYRLHKGFSYVKRKKLYPTP